ncbi:MAG: hypothetical protein ABI366_08200 [Ginsengibacter sp.]
MIQSLVKKFIPVIGLFLLINMVVFIFFNSLKAYGFNMGFLIVANVIIFLLTFFGFYIQIKGVRSTNINAFIRGIYSSLLLKMFVMVGAIIIYILVMGGEANRPSILTSMGIYLAYTFLEVIQLMKIVRKKPDA